MKYRVTLAGKKISDSDRNVKIVAVSANNAKAIAQMRYKLEPIKAVRLGSAPSTVQTMNTIRDDFITAKAEGDIDTASQKEKAFYSTLNSIKGNMDVVSYQMASKVLPTLPPMGK